MDLVIAAVSGNKEPELCLKTCQSTHEKHISGVGYTYVVPIPDGAFIGMAVVEAMSIAGLSDPFILTTDTTFLTSDFEPREPYCREKFAVRKGEAVDRMTNTLAYLLDHGYPTFDYEMNGPIVVHKDKAKEVTSMGLRFHFRTMYGNMTHTSAKRTADFHIDPWIHSMDPSTPVVSFGPTALRHLKCRQWIRKLHNKCLSTAQKVRAQ